jgi:hypothetical protein
LASTPVVHGPALGQCNGRGAETPFLTAEPAVAGRRQQKHRTNAPDQTGSRRRLGREEQALQEITDPELMAGVPGDVVLIDDRQDRARNHVPLLIQ